MFNYYTDGEDAIRHDSYLMHYGVPGMRWGKGKYSKLKGYIKKRKAKKLKKRHAELDARARNLREMQKWARKTGYYKPNTKKSALVRALRGSLLGQKINYKNLGNYKRAYDRSKQTGQTYLESFNEMMYVPTKKEYKWVQGY